MDEIVTKNRGVFGKVQVTLPMQVKDSMLSWMRKSGMGKAEFFRVALMIGTVKLADQVKAKPGDEGFSVVESIINNLEKE